MSAGTKWAIGISAPILVLLLVPRVGLVLLLVFTAALIANFLQGLAERAARWSGLGYLPAYAVVLALTFGSLTGISWLSASRFARESDRLARELPEAVRQVMEPYADSPWVQRIQEELPEPSSLANSQVLRQVTGFFSSVVGAIVGAVIIVVMALFLGADPELYRRGALRLLPIAKREQGLRVLEAVSSVLWLWMLAKFASMAVIGLLTYIGLLILGIPLAATLALIAGLLSFIPNFGPILSAIPAVLLAFAQSPAKAVQTVVLYLIVQAIESNVVSPLIERKTVRLPPALTMSVQVLLGLLAGGLGLFVASPLLAATMAAVQEVYVKDALGDDLSEETLPARMRSPDRGG